MAGQNTLIIANDYNVIQSKIALVLGSGTGNKGYGQTLASSQVGQFSKITVTQWSNLRNDIARARQHQTGVTLGTKAPEDAGYVAGFDLPIPTVSSQVKESWRAAYLSMATDADTNYLVAPPPAAEVATATLVPEQFKVSSGTGSPPAGWNGTIRQEIVVSWPTADDARYFFNSGSEIQITSDRSGGVGGLKDSTWTGMLADMGTISFNHTRTVATGSGSASTLGFYDITTTDNLIFEKGAPSGDYTPNRYYIYARVNDTGANRRVLILTIHWGDESPQPNSFPDPGFGIDENVTGTLTSTVKVLRSATNVSVPTPSATTTSIA